MRQGNGNSNPFQNGFPCDSYFNADGRAPWRPPNWRWKLAEPGDAVPKGEWWRLFHDPILDGLESNALAEIGLQLWPIALFFAAALAIGAARYRRTLD
jgi:hypothetical protein